MEAMSILENILGAGSSAVFATEMMNILGLNQYDLEDPVRYERFKEVIAKLKDNPQYSYIAKKVTLGKSVDKLDHLWGYLAVNDRADLIEKEIEALDKEISTLTDLSEVSKMDEYGSARHAELSKKKAALEESLEKSLEEISLYQ